jgi:hypothetical protein
MPSADDSVIFPYTITSFRASLLNILRLYFFSILKHLIDVPVMTSICFDIIKAKKQVRSQFFNANLGYQSLDSVVKKRK